MLHIVQPAHNVFGQSPQALTQTYLEDNRPPLAFREDWKDGWRDDVLNQDARVYDYHEKNLDAHLQNRSLRHVWYGPGAKATNMQDKALRVEYIRHIAPKDDPGYLWTGNCTGPCAITLQDRNNYFEMWPAISSASSNSIGPR
jgi:hypothetical protein